MQPLSAAAVLAVAALLAAPAVAGNPWQPLAVNGPQRVTIHIAASPAGREVVRDANIAVVPGIAVRLTVLNASREFHSFTIPALHVNAVVMPGSPAHPRATTIVFTPHEVGTYRWHCDFCPAVHHSGGMTGKLYALVSG